MKIVSFKITATQLLRQQLRQLQQVINKYLAFWSRAAIILITRIKNLHVVVSYFKNIFFSDHKMETGSLIFTEETFTFLEDRGVVVFVSLFIVNT